jgi:hypothetical protein
MQRISWFIGLSVMVAVLATTATMAQETLDNAAVIGLKQAGLGDTVILNKIKASKCNFDISTDALKKLKEGGLSDDVINAIIGAAAPSAIPEPPKVVPAVVSNDPNAPHEPGIWLYQEQDTERRMVKLKSRSSGGSSGWNKKSRVVLYGASAILQITAAAPGVFYYYEQPRQEGAFDTSTAATTADDLVLARMEVRADKNERRLAVGKEDFFGGKKSGLDSKAYIPTTTEKVSDGIYRLAPVQALPPGEYCFIDKHDASREALKYRDVELYDFGVKK